MIAAWRVSTELLQSRNEIRSLEAGSFGIVEAERDLLVDPAVLSDLAGWMMAASGCWRKSPGADTQAYIWRVPGSWGPSKRTNTRAAGAPVADERAESSILPNRANLSGPGSWCQRP